MNIKHVKSFGLIAYCVIVILGCKSNTSVTESQSTSTLFDWGLPAGVFAPRIPADNPMTNEKVELGRFLFYDTNLSANQVQSCSSCHLQEAAFADHNPVGIGSTGEFNIKNPPSLTNTGYYTSYSWANPSLSTLERFVILPITGETPIELGVAQEHEEMVLGRFKNSPMYQEMFKKAFPDVANPFTLEYIVKAISAFNRTLNSFNSSYDKYLRGDSTAMNDSAKRGMDLFMGEKAECFHCHEGVRFSDSTADEKSFSVEQFFHNIGLYNVDGKGSYTFGNQGLYEITMKNVDKGKFKAPTLRNVELTYPYMHDGSMATLEEVIELHSNGGRNITSGEHTGDGRQSPYLSDLISAKNFTQQEKEDLVAFLKSLTDHEFVTNPKLSNPFVKK